MNTQTQNALKMAIEYAQDVKRGAGIVPTHHDALINACKEALKPHPDCDEACMFQCQMERKYSQEKEPVSGCGNCHACLINVKDERGFPVSATRMILCPVCGNKRCPKASNHRYDCTDSNDTNQIGSIYRTHPAQPLSDDEIDQIIVDEQIPVRTGKTAKRFARAIEKALKEKNT